MYRIGDFSKASKTTIKTLRYYEKEGLLIPTFVDPYILDTGIMKLLNFMIYQKLSV